MTLKSSTKKRICSLLLTGVMLASMVPTSVFADETITEPETVVETVAETPVADNVTETTEAATTPETQISSLNEISDNTEEPLSNEDGEVWKDHRKSKGNCMRTLLSCKNSR